MTEHPKNETEWSDDDHMERIFAAWVQSRPADASDATTTSTEAGSPEATSAGVTGADPATEDVVTGAAPADDGLHVDEAPGDERAFPRSLAKKTSLPDWFVDEPSTPAPSASEPAAFPEPSMPSPPADEPAAAFPEPSGDEAAMPSSLPSSWDDDTSFPDTSEEEPAPPEPQATDKGVATSTRWSRTDDDVIPRAGKRRWRRKGR